MTSINEQGVAGSQGSLEKAISGNYQFDIGDVLKEAWARTNGAKGQLWLATLAYAGVYVAATFFLAFIFRTLGAVDHPKSALEIVLAVVRQLVLIGTTLPMSIGLYMLGVKRSVDRPMPVSGVFEYFSKSISLLVTIILLYLMAIIGFALLIIPGIYLVIAYSFAMLLVVDKQLSPWEALETSRKAITKRWFTFFGFGLAIILIMLVSAIPVGIGMIWTYPFAIIAYGIIYRNIFGYEASKVV